MTISGYSLAPTGFGARDSVCDLKMSSSGTGYSVSSTFSIGGGSVFWNPMADCSFWTSLSSCCYG